MSFDLFVQDLPPDARTITDIPDDFAPKPVGRRADIIAGILRVAPTADFTDPTWGVINGPKFRIEVNIGPEEEIEGFAFHVRGGQDALLVVADILRELGLRAIAPGMESGFFDLTKLGPSFAQWQAFQRQVIRDCQNTKPIGGTP